jgi:H+-translocating NAD(P) transhydrogenase subunit alpha
VNEIGLDAGVIWLTFFILSVFVGIEVISKVSTVLHTPLMSGTNAIHGIILIGAMLVTGHSDSVGVTIVGTIAIVLAAANLVGGFVVTDRMLQMFSRKKKPKEKAEAEPKPEKAEKPPKPEKPKKEEKPDKHAEKKIEQQVEQMSEKQEEQQAETKQVEQRTGADSTKEIPAVEEEKS